MQNITWQTTTLPELKAYADVSLSFCLNAVDPSRRQVVCTTCPRSDDYRPDRLTIEYDAVTGKVVKLQCG